MLSTRLVAVSGIENGETPHPEGRIRRLIHAGIIGTAMDHGSTHPGDGILTQLGR